MRPQSCKSKGRRLQQWFRDLLLKYAPSLTEDDIRSTSMGAPGVDLLLSTAALQEYPFAIESKNVEKLNIHQAMEQARTNCRAGLIPLVVFKKNHSDTFVALPAESFLQLLKGKK
jgi:hypothetical protein